jgi:MATE family multidrug resistance protein
VIRPSAKDFRQLFALAVPVVFVQIGLMAMGVVDTMIMGRVSAEGLAGAAIGNIYTYTLGTFGYGMLMSLDPLVSQAVGAKDEPSVVRAFQRGIVIAVVLGVCAVFAILPVESVLRALGQPDVIVRVATPFVHVQAPGMFAFFLFIALRQTLTALGHLRPMVYTIVIANLLNGVLCWSLVFGHFGLPPMGAVGAGLATTVARWSMLLMLSIFGWQWIRPRLRWRADSLHAGPILRMVRIGIPIACQYMLEFGVFAAVALLMGRLGPVPAAAHQIAINIASLTFMVPLGVSSAGSVLVGRAIGAGDSESARRSGVSALAVGATFMAGSACILLLVPHLLARAYTPDAAVVALAATLIPIAGVFQVFDGLQVVSIGVLRGTGDTRTPLIVNLIGYWIIALPISLWLGIQAGLGPRGMWWGLTAGLVVVALVLLARVRVRLWGPLERIRVDEPPASQALEA